MDNQGRGAGDRKKKEKEEGMLRKKKKGREGKGRKENGVEEDWEGRKDLREVHKGPRHGHFKCAFRPLLGEATPQQDKLLVLILTGDFPQLQSGERD